MFDFLIVGAGLAGAVIAERLATREKKKVLVVERKNHIAGNTYDFHNEHGILVHKYGPHIFHTNSKEVFEYLSHFTSWRTYEHRVLASVDGLFVPIPINLDTVNTLYGTSMNSFQMDDFLKSKAEQSGPVLTSEDAVVSKVGRELYEKFFRNYTRKHWGLDPSELDASVTSRIPVRNNRDNRYFTDTFQAMPLHGYTKMVERMLSNPNISVLLNTDYKSILDEVSFKEMIYTGPVDYFFDYCYGKLPYRSVEFQFETFESEYHQPVGTLNYPNEHPFTRSTEFKYLTGQKHPKTTVVYEYPKENGDPYYPIPRKDNAILYKKYQAKANSLSGVYFTGRLATYKYYNMDQVVAQSLTLFKRLIANSENRTLNGHSLEIPA